MNVIDAAHEVGVERLLFLGSSCIYPKFAEQPIREDSLLTGPLEPTNDAYAIAKIAGVLHVQAMRRQHGESFISAMPTNLYGPGDNFDLETSHVLPAMIRKFHEAKTEGRDEVVLWGTGSPLREFLHVDDLARAVASLLERYDDAAPINIGVGEDLTIRDLAETVARVVGFEGRLTLGHLASPTARRASCSTSRASTASAGRPPSASKRASDPPTSGTSRTRRRRHDGSNALAHLPGLQHSNCCVEPGGSCRRNRECRTPWVIL